MKNKDEQLLLKFFSSEEFPLLFTLLNHLYNNIWLIKVKKGGNILGYTLYHFNVIVAIIIYSGYTIFVKGKL